MASRRTVLAGLGGTALAGFAGCAGPGLPEAVEIFDRAAADLFVPGAGPDTLADGFGWSEGPSWDQARDCLYFTDVPGNQAFRWTRQDGLSVFLDPSGIAAEQADGMREPGANGLWSGDDGWLYVCNHGRRALQRLDPVSRRRETLVDRWRGLRFNSPNDLVRAADGTLFFTDPPYGLTGLNESPLKEMPVNGVYRLDAAGDCQLLFAQLTFPNGIALSPAEDWLYVSQSDPEAPHIYRVAMVEGQPSGELQLWFDASDFLAAGDPGLPDGMAVAAGGNLYATGPGGVFVLAPEGHLLARIRTGRATANCAFGGQTGQDLFITAHDRLLRIRVRERGVQWRV